MRLPRGKFTLKSMMIALGIVAVVLATERLLFDYAVSLVESHNDYLWHEAVTVWVILNIALSLPIGTSAAIVRAAMKDHAEAQKRIG
jgi:hypothetical protein